MPKYIIDYDAGYGRDVYIEEADSIEEAYQIAQDSWMDMVRDSGHHTAHEYSEELYQKLLNGEQDA